MKENNAENINLHH